MWAKFNSGASASGTAYAEKQLALPGEYWVQADVEIPASTLHACSDSDLFGQAGFVLSVFDSLGSERDGVYARDNNYPHGLWHWYTDDFGDAGVVLTADSTYTIKAHVNGSAISWYFNGVLARGPYSIIVPANGGIRIGPWAFGENCTCEDYYVSNVKIGTIDGGSDLFADDFSSGDFSNWTSTTGVCSVVAAPVQCAPPSLTLAPTHACRGDHVFVSGSDYTPNSAITLVVAGSLTPVTFSEAMTDAGGNIAGYFTLPDGFFAPSFTTVSITTAAGDISPLVRLDVCCNVTADATDATTTHFFGPTTPVGTGALLDYVHADGAHWMLWKDPSVKFPLTLTLPPPPNHTLNITRISDDGISITTYPLDTEYAWGFDDSTFAFIFCNNWETNLFFSGWDKPVLDAKLASDGTTVWAVVLTRESVTYPYISSDDGHCGEPSQAAQFVDLSTLTSGFTVFPTSPGDGGAPYVRIYHNSIGTLDIYSPDFPNSDGGQSWFGYWNPPRVVVFAGDVGGFTRIGEIDSLYAGGDTSGVGNDNGFVGGPAFPRFNDGPRGRFISGVSAAAAAAEPGVCHVVWAEGGAWGRCGAGAPDAVLPDVWDGDQANQDYRVSYSRWGPGGNVFDTDLWHTHIDRTNWWFPFESDGATVHRCGYSWPVSADLTAIAAYDVKNDHGAPALLLARPLTRISPSPTGSLTDSLGNPWVDNGPDFMEGTFRYYDLSGGGAVLQQTLDASLLPSVAELSEVYGGAVANNRLAYGVYGDWGSLFLRGFSISLLYDDPSDAGDPVYAVMLPWGTARYDANENPVGAVEGGAIGFPATGVYRIAADGSQPFDLLDGTRLLGYSICLPGFRGGIPPDGDFFSDPKSVWQPGGPVKQLDRICNRQWANPHQTSGPFTNYPGRATVNKTGVYYSAAEDALYYACASPDFLSFQLARLRFCRGCFTCSCAGAAGLHVSKRITWGS